MKNPLLTLAIAGAIASSASAAVITVDFDDAGSWTSGSGAINSYQTDHSYSESNWTFTGGPALRQTTTTQDGFPGALGTYSWRLRDEPVTWTAIYTLALPAGESFSAFGLDARRWDATASPNFLVEYSTNGGANWFTATTIGSSGTIDSSGLGNSSDWSSFSQSISSPAGLAANQFQVRLTQASGGRLMVDNFTSTTIPETTSALLGALGLLGILRRRR